MQLGINIYTCFDDRPACIINAISFCSKHMLLLRFLHRMAVHIAITALRSDVVDTRLLLLVLSRCFAFSGLVHSL